MKALDYLYRYNELNRLIADQIADAAVEEKLARRHSDKKLKEEALQRAADHKKEASKLILEQTEMERFIWTMPQERSRVLRLRYFYGDSLRQIAIDMHRDLEYVEELHRRGMENLQRLLDFEEKREKAGIETGYRLTDAETKLAMKGV